MSKAMPGRIFIGTSGWQYRHWWPSFYPVDLPQKDAFAFYADHFSTVELNNPFYRLPSFETFEKWKRQSPPGFLYSVKTNRFITHMKKLSDPEATTSRFFASVRGLGRKCGPLLYQLPPRWHADLPRLQAFIKGLPRKYRHVFEFRDTTWYKPETFALLEKQNAAFCIYELAGHVSPLRVTADFVYIRLHGPGRKYQGKYDRRSLRAWARRCHAWSGEGRDVFVYFDNDQNGYAAANAITLKQLVDS